MASERTSAPRRHKALLILAAGLLLVILPVFWLLATTAGARAAFAAAEALSGGAIAVNGVHGRIIGSIGVDSMTIDTADNRIALADLQIGWRPSALMRNKLHLTRLHAGRVAITEKTKKPPEPPRLPDRIALPLQVQADDVQVNRIDVAPASGTPVAMGPVALGFVFEDNRYLLDLRRFSASQPLDNGKLTFSSTGKASLSAITPYAVEGNFSIDSQVLAANRDVTAAGKIALNGSLADLNANVAATIDQARVEGNAQLHPFTAAPVGKTQLTARAIDLSRFDAELPGTALRLDLSVDENGSGILQLRNTDAGTIDERKLPLAAFEAAFRQDARQWHFDRIGALLGSADKPAGKIGGSGRYADGALTLTLNTQSFDLRRVDRRMRTTQLDGELNLRHAGNRQEFSLSLSEPLKAERLTLAAHGTYSDTRLTLDRIDMQAGQGRLEASGHVAFSGSQSFDAKGRITRFRLHDLGTFAHIPSLELNARLDLHGVRQPQLEADLAFRIDNSRLAGQPLTGEGDAQLRGERLQVPRFVLESGANRLHIDGQLADGGTQLSFALDAPQLRQLGPSFAGALHASGTISGNMMQPHIDAQWAATRVRLPSALQIDAMQGKAEVVLDRKRPFIVDSAAADMTGKGLRHGGDHLASMVAQLRFSPQENAPLALSVRADGIATGRLLAEKFTATANGTTGSHTIVLVLNETGQNWHLKGNGGLSGMESNARWKGSIDALDASGRFNARLADPAALLASAEQIQLDRLHLDTDTGRIDVEQFSRDVQGIATRGRVEKLQLAQLLQYAMPKAPVRTDLQLGGEWDLRIGDTLSGAIEIRREQGDLTVLGGTPVVLGLRSLRANATVTRSQLALQIQADGKQLGQIAVIASTAMGNGDNRLAIAPEAPIAGSVRIEVPSLSWLGPIMSPAIALDGRLQSDIVVGGTFAQPRLNGRIAGEALRFSMASIGLDLRQGALAGEFQDDQLQIRNLSFQGPEGRVALSGPINLGGGTMAAQLTLHAERFALLNRSDRRFVVSGDTRLDWQDRQGKLSGALKIDSGFVDLGEAGKPELSDDVVIVGQEKNPAAKTAFAIDIALSLGDGVTITGRGLDAVLGGQIRVLTEAGETLQAQGAFQVIKGTYTAYGRELAIEQGALRFRGSIANPSLDILAMRRGQEVEAGVAVRGNVLTPRVTLVSEPTVPDAEKLAWLVLGRGLSTAGESDMGALQAAASALLSEGAKAGVQSRIASAFGLDTFNVGTSKDNLQQRIVTLGKQISSKLYVSYQQGLESAASVVQLRYVLSPKLSVEAEAGTRSAISLFYNIAFD